MRAAPGRPAHWSVRAMGATKTPRRWHMVREIDLRDLRVHTTGRSREFVTGDQRTMVPVFDYAVKSSPCQEACPAGHDISRALHLVQSGRFDEALELFREESPFPSVTGRVCYYPCESSCNRKDYDRSVAINALERAAGDYGRATASAARVTHATQPVAVVGSGPAGVTAAYHLVRLGYPVTVFEREPMPGGALRYGIPRYRLPADVLDREFERLARLGIKFRTGCQIGRDIEWAQLESDYSAIFIGVGKAAGSRLPTPGIEDIPAQSGIAFLHAVNSTAGMEIGGNVAVIGGGDVAIDVVRSSIRLGAGSVHLYCLESREAMPAHPEEIQEAEREGLYFNPSWAAQQIRRTPDGRIKIAFRGVDRLDADLRPTLNDRATAVTVDHLIYAVGQKADADWLPADLWRRGGIDVDAAGRTARPNVFAGGDITGSYNVVQAIGAGKRAAIGIDCYLQGREPQAWIARASVGGRRSVSMQLYCQALAGSGDGRGDSGTADIVLIDRINLDYFPRAERMQRPAVPPRERQGFREVNGGLTREEAVAESLRCFNCAECTTCGNCFIYCPDSAVVQGENGFFSIDDAHCKGCGQCVHECPRSAMTMVVEADRARVAMEET